MTGLHPLKLAAIPDGWRLFSARKSDPAFVPFKKQVLERDQYVCRYCGFQANKYQEIVNLDNNYHNNKLTNLVTACCFCAQCFFLESVGKDDYGGGVLIYLPEVSQNDLNGLCHVLFCAMFSATDYSTESQNIYQGLKMRTNVVEVYLGDGMSDSSLFGRMLLDAPDKDRNRIEKDILPMLRLLPSYSKFNKQVKEWSESVTEELSVTK